MYLLCLAFAVCLLGCTASGEEKESLRTDTVVYIPVNPEPEETEAPTGGTEDETVSEETEASTETTAPKSTASSSSAGKTTTSKSSTSKTSTTSTSKTTTSKTDTAKTETKATEPPAETKPAGTEPPQTEPPETQSPETEIPETEPPETEPQETEPPETQPPEADIYDISDYAAGSMEYAVLEQINAYRTEAGVGPLAMDSRLCAIASVRAYEASLSWSHTRPDGRDCFSVLSDYGYGYSAAVENLSYAAGTGAEVIVAQWMASESHRADLLSGSFTTCGVGVYDAGGTAFVANFLIG